MVDDDEEVVKSGDIVTPPSGDVELLAVDEVTLSAGNRTGMPVLVLMLNIDAIDWRELVMFRVVVLVMVVESTAVLGELVDQVVFGYRLASVTVVVVGSAVDS